MNAKADARRLFEELGAGTTVLTQKPDGTYTDPMVESAWSGFRRAYVYLSSQQEAQAAVTRSANLDEAIAAIKAMPGYIEPTAVAPPP